VLVACWSSKGGSGTTVVAGALAAVLGRRGDDGSLLVDLAGDVPVSLGMPEPPGPGVTEWLAAGPEAPIDALGRIEIPATPDVSLLPCGRLGLLDPERAELLAAILAADPRPVVVDVGAIGVNGDPDVDRVRRVFALAATHSLLVTRACFISLRRAINLPFRPSGIVLVHESYRSLGGREVADVLGAPIVATVPVDGAIARAVDAGLLASRIPRVLTDVLLDAA
jgi:hypothetical protein